MQIILSLNPNVSHEQAIQLLEGRGLTRYLRSLRRGHLRSLALVHVPFRLFSIEIANRGSTDLVWLAQDTVTGSFDPYKFDGPVDDRVSLVTTRNYILPSLSNDEVMERLKNKVRRTVFGHGFFRVRQLEIHAMPVLPEFYVPYWVGFSGSDSNANLAVIDAVRGVFEGAKVRKFLYEWLVNKEVGVGGQESAGLYSCEVKPQKLEVIVQAQ